MKKIKIPVDALSEGTREALRTFVIGCISFVITSGLDFAVSYFSSTKVDDVVGSLIFMALLAGFRSLDKYWHERAKQTLESNMFTSISKLLQFEYITL